MSRRPRRRTLSPAKVIALSFGITGLIGTLLLWLPWSHAPGEDLTFLDALFTASSALCVTGLIVVDTGTAWSPFGQSVIMILIQLGGLVLITFGTLFALAFGRRVGFGERLRVAEQISAFQVGGVVELVRNIVLLSLGVELVGALLLYPAFAAEEGRGAGAFYALFHSISASNNAGFAFYGDSLSRFVGDPVVNIVITGLFILGGLGFIVQVNLIGWVRERRKNRLTLHTKIVLAVTAVLCLLGFGVVAALEWNNPDTLGGLPLGAKLWGAFFQGVTPRTAGFNTVDTGSLENPTLIFTILIMFIGGSPGSTAGGIKTVTFFVLAASAWSMVRGYGELTIFGRRVGTQTAIKADTVVLLSSGVVIAALFLLSITESVELLPLAFETMSAFGTVGLSMGATGELSVVGQLVVIVLMYLGRVGPLTFALALVQEPRGGDIKHPEEEVLIS